MGLSGHEGLVKVFTRFPRMRELVALVTLCVGFGRHALPTAPPTQPALSVRYFYVSSLFKLSFTLSSFSSLN
jgi:hypothetical protein